MRELILHLDAERLTSVDELHEVFAALVEGPGISPQRYDLNGKENWRAWDRGRAVVDALTQRTQLVRIDAEDALVLVAMGKHGEQPTAIVRWSGDTVTWDVIFRARAVVDARLVEPARAVPVVFVARTHPDWVERIQCDVRVEPSYSVFDLTRSRRATWTLLPQNFGSQGSMAKKRRYSWIVGVVLAVVLMGGGAWWAFRATDVTLIAVETRDVVEVYVVTGRVRARTTSGIGSELAGRVANVHVAEGERPARGAALVDLQPLDAELSMKQADARLAIVEKELERARRGPTRAQRESANAELSGARADLAQADKDLARARAMVRDGVGTAVDLERAQTAVQRASSRVDLANARLAELNEQPRSSDINVAQARVDEARTNLEQTRATLGKTTITAPFDGLVLSANASIGENVQPGQVLVTLAKTDDMEFYAEVNEDYFTRLKAGQSATVIFPSSPEQKHKAQVRRVGPEVDSDRGVVAVHLDALTLPERVVPGLTADVAVELRRLSDARALPRRAVVRQGGDSFVFVIKDGQATRVDVTIEAEGESYLAVKGLDGVDQVIKDAGSIEAGARVRGR